MPKPINKGTESITSPTGVEQGCLCADDTYHKDCCNGELGAQGVGPLIGGGELIIDQIIVNRVITRING